MAQKTDLQRLGIFKELSYHTIGDPYVPFSTSMPPGRPVEKGVPPMYLAGGYSKTKSANSDGYFNPFQSLYIGDGSLTYADIKKQERKANKAKIIDGRDWIPSSGHKHRCGVGSPFGNFQEIFTALDQTKKVVQRVPEMKNFYTNPGKRGTGYGYPDVCLNPFPSWQQGDTNAQSASRIFAQATAEHQAKLQGRKPFVSMCRTLDAFDENPWAKGDPLAPGGPSSFKFGIANFPKSMQIGPTFVPSHPAKKDGGMKDGCLNRFPEYKNDQYVNPNTITKEDKSKFVAGQWIPNSCTAVVVPQPSIVNKNTMLRFNVKTRKHQQKVWDAC